MDDYLKYIKKGKHADIVIKQQSGFLRYSTSFKDPEENNFVLLKPDNKQEAFNFPSGQKLFLYIYTNVGVWRLECSLIEIVGSDCKISKPTSVERMQRREFIRVTMPVKTIVKLRRNSESKSTEVYSKNISAKGINFIIKDDLSKWDKVDISLLFPEETINTVCQVIKTKPVNTARGLIWDTSLMFMTISNKEIDFIVKKCFEYEAQQRRKMLDSEEEN